uniref:Uncharacterized protein n=1 Tax=Anopheles culicifacies TaxID=139723 RepID=A0A182M2D1_9DIPT
MQSQMNRGHWWCASLLIGKAFILIKHRSGAMDFSEALKIPIGKSHAPLPGGSIVNGGPGAGSSHAVGAAEQGAGYVTEKLYMLLQLYLQNKGWNPSVELLQCFAELKDTPILPSAAYLQALASRVALDNQGRLVLRETGKIVLPYEHFANAVMLKHMSGPHGLHLSIEATVRAVMDSYTIGRDSFGMEKEFIVEVVQSCPSPACRYYKGQLGVGSFIDQPSFGANSGSGGAAGPPPGGHLNSAEYLTHLQQQLGQQNAGLFELGANEPLFDTIQLLQMLRNCLPAPHIPVSSWKGSEVSGNTETALN